MSLLGHDVRAVGCIKQTIQCVHIPQGPSPRNHPSPGQGSSQPLQHPWCGLRCQRQDLLQTDWSVGQETPDPPDEECDDKDHQKDITNLDDTITNKADDTESVKVDDKIDDGVLDSAADKDEVKDDENDNKWAPGTEVYTASN